MKASRTAPTSYGGGATPQTETQRVESSTASHEEEDYPASQLAAPHRPPDVAFEGLTGSASDQQQRNLDNISVGYSQSLAHDSDPTADVVVVHQQLPELANPSTLLRQALIDMYVEHMFPLVPVMELKDLTDPTTAVILKQSLYLGGSMMRHFGEYPGNLKPEDSFHRIKSLLFIHDQQDSFALLKCLCILSFWSCQSPTKVTLDSPSQWSAMAIRLAVQQGLHREATYSKLKNRQCARRIWWPLLVSLEHCFRPIIRD